jgi:hypothetical protein
MILIFTPSTITRFASRDGYSYSEPVTFTGTPYADLPTSLIGWLTQQLASGETVSQVVLEQADEAISAAVSVSAPQGQRTFALLSDALPDDLRTGLLAAWRSLLTESSQQPASDPGNDEHTPAPQ